MPQTEHLVPAFMPSVVQVASTAATSTTVCSFMGISLPFSMTMPHHLQTLSPV